LNPNEDLPLSEFASSLGLAFTPQAPIIPKSDQAKEDAKGKKNINRLFDFQ
jgi:hypothetical protein